MATKSKRKWNESPEVEPAEQQASGIDEARAWNKKQTRTLLRMIGLVVRYADHMELIEAEEFNQAVGLAMLDKFSTLSEGEKAERLKITVEKVETLRSHDAFSPIAEDVDEKSRLIAENRSMDEWAKFFESDVARELAGIAFFAKRPLDKQKALEEFSSRRSAKKGREGESQQALIVPPQFVELMKEASETIRKMQEVREEKVIDVDASVVRTSNELEEADQVESKGT